ncbi:3-hydroxyacyl-[acyl-carrier-protein] dehydratase FabZ [Candidatus Woesearchaeota archaeon]|jgi:3-hydroxyacyl-[acyl-carrier-protein] dehydratase|nr:3-hydroxyacyl-[acyl-carrier-protein] dehydratase FabZ [Candidatus Woesearchaeota archaeon]|tara:strand:- start:472 stop:963 length:492 start_codon:yes stop_codon:yes gene_type:complete
MDQFNELKNDKGEINTEQVMKIIPYNEHFLFIDKVISLSSNRIVTIKNISGNEDFLKGHFVGFPIMPGALTVEGLGQTATLLARSNIPNHLEKDVLAYRLKDVKFSAPVLPGDQLRFELDLIAQDERGAILQGKAFVKDDLVAEALLMLAIVNKTDFRSKYAK